MKPTNRRARQLTYIRAWYQSKGKKAPIDKAEYFDKFAIERLTQGKGNKYYKVKNFPASISEAKKIAESSMLDQLMIKRRGLADSSWGWMLGRLGKQDNTPHKIINGVTNVDDRSDPSQGSYSVEFQNKLVYIRKAMTTNTTSILFRAGRAMVDEMEGHIKRARVQSGLKAT
jgi:hypothetical protein